MYEGYTNAYGAVHVASPCALGNWDKFAPFRGHKSLSCPLQREGDMRCSAILAGFRAVCDEHVDRPVCKFSQTTDAFTSACLQCTIHGTHCETNRYNWEQT